MFSRFFLRLTTVSCPSLELRSYMPTKKRKNTLSTSVNKKRKITDREYDDADQSPSPQSSVMGFIEESPGIVATREAAAAVDTNPPHRQLLKAMEASLAGEHAQRQAGDSVVYWMRMEDMRSQ